MNCQKTLGGPSMSSKHPDLKILRSAFSFGGRQADKLTASNTTYIAKTQSKPTTNKSHHINLCTFPGSCSHSKPLSKNNHIVAPFTTKNQTVSNHRRLSC